MKKQLLQPTIDIWQAQVGFRLKRAGKPDVIVKTREFLFLTGQENNYYIFKTESGESIKIHVNAERDKKVVKVF